ncbi:uncharacterized protein LOC115736000 [Rhodamnia argentea]|uniref:Uncharacterized protein LOC115736000 n=1 Tax=Rhodamnia argentea TaxID=178133 RepID=A0A8B8NN12_9MYRT|nr:uncharacterized protein LOC115736000 [Rhodamnia argentea]
MSRPSAPPPRLGPQRPLHKQHSWSPDVLREEAWQRRKGSFKGRRRASVTDDDLDELKGCIELGFGFDSPDVDPKLSDTFPALELYRAVNKRYHRSLSRSSSVESSLSLSSLVSDNDAESSGSIYDPGDDPETVKTRLRQWAQIVACSVRQSSSPSSQ